MTNICITKEWLEKILGREIKSFTLGSGSSPGDGFAGILHSVEVQFPSENPDSDFLGSSESKSNSDLQERCNKVNIVVKTFPTLLERQIWMSKINIFHKEFLFYTIVPPELSKFREEFQNLPEQRNFEDRDFQNLTKLPIPDFIFGASIDFKADGIDLNSVSELCKDPLTNCVVMADLRKTGNFEMAKYCARQGLDLPHCQLVIGHLARFHALFWAFKQQKGLRDLSQKFPFLKTSLFDMMDQDDAAQILDRSFATFRDILGQDQGQLLKSLERIQKLATDILALFTSSTKPLSQPSRTKDNILRIPKNETDHKNEQEWLTLCHADSWINNMLFKYKYKENDKEQVTDVVLLDFQLTFEGDPMTDLVYFLYSSTTYSFRKQNLDHLLITYEKNFTDICSIFKVNPFPGFSRLELERRFHRAKTYGFLSAVLNLSLFLGVDAPWGVERPEGEQEKIRLREAKSLLASRVVDITVELYEEGVI